MEVKRRIPLVLIDNTHLSLASFRVILPTINDEALEEKLRVVLSTMLKADTRVQSEPDGVDGIEVDEVSADDIGAHFPQDEG